MKYVLSFMLGTLFGASVALLLAPETGEDLRSKIKSSAETGISKAQQDLQKAVSEAQSRMEKLSGEMQVQMERLSGELQSLESRVKDTIKTD